MMRTVQLELADAVLAASVRDALCRSGPWRVESVERPDPAQPGVLVVDEAAFERLSLPLAHPERVVLLSRQNPRLLAEAWDAGIVSVVSPEDSVPTVLLAIMATALRVAKPSEPKDPSEISPKPDMVSARISPHDPNSRSKRCKIP